MGTDALTAPLDAAYRDALLYNTPFFSEHHLKIVNKGGQLVPFILKPEQVRLWEKFEEQRKAGKPMRGIGLKARQIGASTLMQGMQSQRYLQIANRRSLVLAHNAASGGNLFEMGRQMYINFPTDSDVEKPEVMASRRSRELWFGNPSKEAMRLSDIGLNSRFLVDTAKEFEAGRGFTWHDVHASEIAFWDDIERKLMAILTAVPNEPGTIVFLESTANGMNAFHDLWEDAYAGKNDYFAFFSPWFAEPSYVRPFANEQDRAEFEQTIGDGPEREAEPDLIDQFDLTLEQLHWRYHTLMNPPFLGDLRRFQQEMPATPEEAFISTGSKVFQMHLVQRVIRDTKDTDPQAGVGTLEPEGYRRMKSARGLGVVDVPHTPKWKPQAEVGFGVPLWKVWEHPVRKDEPIDPQDPNGEKHKQDGQYIVAVDPAGDEEADNPENAFHAIEVIDHRTRHQVAEWVGQIDPDLVGLQAYLAALYYNRAWLAPEVTGGYGLSMARRIFLDYHYPFLYRRTSLEDRKERQTERLGWDTKRASKVVIVDGLREILREGTKERFEHGIRSARLASELQTYKRGPNGKMEPEKGKHADCLMAFGIAHQIAQEKPLRSGKPTSSTSTVKFRPRDTVGGY